MSDFVRVVVVLVQISLGVGILFLTLTQERSSQKFHQQLDSKRIKRIR